MSAYKLLFLHIKVRTKDKHDVVLADFGLAQFISSTLLLGTRTMQAGTLGFQSPELLRAERGAIDEACDAYSFGAVMLELFGEKGVWPDLMPYQIITRVVGLNQYPDIPNDTSSVFRTSHCKVFSCRHATEALDKLSDSTPISLTLLHTIIIVQ